MNNNKYHQYALDESGILVHINDVRNENGKKYYCPFCHGEMIRKYGNGGRLPHFAHKVNTDKCSYDNYLHSIAKIIIRKWFNESERIMLKYDVYCRCPDEGECKWGRINGRYSNNCYRMREEECNLKAWFKTCEEEKRYRNEQGDEFIADLFCKNEKNSNKPLFIEIFVTHECEDKKKKSGIRIIEFHIQSEDDIIRIIKSPYIYENEYTKFYNIKAEKKDPSIGMSLCKFIVFQSLKCNLEQSYTCKNYGQQHRGIYEITFNSCHDNTFEMGVAKAIADGYINRSCYVCRYHTIDWDCRHICKLYKKYGTNKYCRDNDAPNCTKLRLDEDLYNKLICNYEEYDKKYNVEIWKL